MRHCLRVVTISSVLILGIAGSSCTKIKFAYNHLDWVVLPKLKSYATFNQQQKDAIDREFHAYMRWHRKAMLPQYAKFLQAAASAVDHPVSFDSSQAVILRLEFRKNYEQTLTPFLGASSRVLTTFSEEQTRSLESRFEEEDHQFRTRYLDSPPEKQNERRERNIFEIVEFFSGELKNDQRKQLREKIRQFPSLSITWLEARRRWRKELQSLLLKKRASEIETFLLGWFVKRTWINTPQLKEIDAQWERATDDFTIATVKILNDHQRQKCRKTLLSLAAQFDELSREKIHEE